MISENRKWMRDGEVADTPNRPLLSAVFIAQTLFGMPGNSFAFPARNCKGDISMKSILAFSILLFLALPTFAQEKQWDKYIPKKPRKLILEKALRRSGLGAALKGRSSVILWLTEETARAVISDRIDKERLTSEEAEERYRSLRKGDAFRFLIYGSTALNRGSFPIAESVSKAFAANELFLQRGDNKEIFSRGSLSNNDYDIYSTSASPDAVSSYVATFPKTSSKQKRIVNSLDDRIQIYFVFNTKKIVLEYKIRDLVDRLEDL